MSEERVPGAEWTNVWRQTGPRRRVAAAIYGRVPWHENVEGALFLRFVGFDSRATTEETAELFLVPRVWIPTLMRTLGATDRYPIESLCRLVDSQSTAEHLRGVLREAYWAMVPGHPYWSVAGPTVDTPGLGYPSRRPSVSARRRVLHLELRRAFAESENFLGAVCDAYRGACVKVTGEDEPTPTMCRWAYPEIDIVDWDDDFCDDPDADIDIDDTDALAFAGISEGISITLGVNVTSYLLKGCDYWLVDGNISYGLAPATQAGRLSMLIKFAGELGITSLDECEYSGIEPGLEVKFRAWLEKEQSDVEIEIEIAQEAPAKQQRGRRRRR